MAVSDVLSDAVFEHFIWNLIFNPVPGVEESTTWYTFEDDLLILITSPELPVAPVARAQLYT